MKLRLVEKKPEAKDITTFYFQPEAALDYKPGQFLRYYISDPQHDERSENRFFSISAAPFENRIQLTTKFVPGDGSTFKKDLQQLKVGDSIEAFGPSGSFTLDDPVKQYVFIAGGIGITPFRAILLDLDRRGLPLNITLLYANRTQQALFKNEFNDLALKHPEFKIFYVISDEPITAKQLTPNVEIIPGRIDENLIQSSLPEEGRTISNLQSPIYYISGPEPMVMAFEEMLKKLGVQKENTKRDYFPGYTEI